MTKMIFVNLPVTDLAASTRFYQALGFDQNLHFSDDASACMIWSESIYVMLLTHAKWRMFTERALPADGASGVMLSLALDSRESVDAMSATAVASGGRTDESPVQDLGFMYSRDLADPDGNLWGTFWMDPAAIPSDAHPA